MTVTLDEIRAKRYRENVGYHRSRLERFAYELAGKLEGFETAAQELLADDAFDMAVHHLAIAKGELEACLAAVRRAREALS